MMCSVMGGANYTDHAPPGSYINVLDYESPKELAEHLMHLANNEEEYMAYFWWKVGVERVGTLSHADVLFITETLQRPQQ